MSDTKSWNDSFGYLKVKAVNPTRACATYEQIEAQNKKNEQRYGWDKGKATDAAMSRLREEYMRTE